MLINDIKRAVEEEKRWCCICSHAVRIYGGPSPSGPYDGVDCDCRGVIEKIKRQEGWEYKGEKINLFRGEVCSEDFDCEYFEQKLCDECGEDKVKHFCLKCGKRLCDYCLKIHRE